jgi:glutamate-1-semialdehyde 2,1-aminomutase
VEVTLDNRIHHAGVSRFFRSDGKEIIFSHGKKGVVYDDVGNEYIDFILGFGPIILGHTYPDFQSKLKDFIDNGIIFPGYGKWHYKYINKLLGDLDTDYQGVIFKTASEAVIAAIRLATIVTNKKGVIRCGFLGWHDVLIGKSVYWHEPLDSPLRNKNRYEMGMRGIGPDEPVFNWVDLDIQHLSYIIEKEGDKYGVFVMDAYQLSFSTFELFNQILLLCKNHNIQVVLDETKTGGRVSKHGIALDNKFDVDMVVLGKSLSNGAPISLLVGKEDILKYSEIARIGGTFSKELIAIYAGLITLEIMEERSGFDIIKKVGIDVVNTINSSIAELDLQRALKAEPVFDGAMFEIRFSKELMVDMDARDQLIKCLADNGILLLQGHPSFVCLAHQELESQILYEKFRNGLLIWMQGNNHLS